MARLTIHRFGGVLSLSLSKLAEKHDLEMIVQERGGYGERFYAHFARCETVDNGILCGEYGNGKTPAEAIEAYRAKIAGKRLVFGAYTDDRKEFEVPKELTAWADLKAKIDAALEVRPGIRLVPHPAIVEKQLDVVQLEGKCNCPLGVLYDQLWPAEPPFERALTSDEQHLAFTQGFDWGVGGGGSGPNRAAAEKHPEFFALGIGYRANERFTNNPYDALTEAP